VVLQAGVALGCAAVQAAENVVPVAGTAGHKIKALRPTGLGSVPVGGSGGGVLAARNEW
jgi:hypothetical protein